MSNKTTHKNITNFIRVTDTRTSEVKIYDNKKLCAEALDITYSVVEVYLDKSKLYKGRYLIERTETHEKKIIVEIAISTKLYSSIKGIVRTVDSANMVKFTNAICKDFILNYDNEKSN